MHEDQVACTSIYVFIGSRHVTLSAALIYEGCSYLKYRFWMQVWIKSTCQS